MLLLVHAHIAQLDTHLTHFQANARELTSQTYVPVEHSGATAKILA